MGWNLHTNRNFIQQETQAEHVLPDADMQGLIERSAYFAWDRARQKPLDNLGL